MLQIIKKIYKRFKRSYQALLKKIKVYYRDILNKFKYGWSAPLYKERIWVDPGKIKYMIDREEVKKVSGLHRSKASGVVVDWSEVKNIKPVTDEFRIQYCYQHWKEGKTWEKLGVIEHMKQTKSYGSWSTDKIRARFKMLDKAFMEAKNEGRLKTRQELDSNNFRENGGILVHIGKNGIPYFGGNGFHRLAISKVLELEKIPACVGLVDRDAITYLDEYRNPD